jgi:hypothetical protein
VLIQKGEILASRDESNGALLIALTVFFISWLLGGPRPPPKLSSFCVSDVILRYVSETLDLLLCPDGDDRNMLKADEIASNDFSRLIYTGEDKMMLRQCESTTIPAKKFPSSHKTTKNLPVFSLRQGWQLFIPHHILHHASR